MPKLGGQSAALQKCGSRNEVRLTSAMWERFVAEKTEELRDAFDQAVKEIHPSQKSDRAVQVSIKSEELRAVLLRPGQVVEEEVQAIMCGLECCLKSGEGGFWRQKRLRIRKLVASQQYSCN